MLEPIWDTNPQSHYDKFICTPTHTYNEIMQLLELGGIVEHG